MLEILQFGNRIAVNIFDIYIAILLLKSVVKSEVKDKRLLYLSIAMNLLVTFWVDQYASYAGMNLFTYVLLTFLLVYCYEMSMKKKLCATVGITILIILSEGITAWIMGLNLFGLFEKAANSESVALFLSRIIAWIIAAILQKLFNRDEFRKLSPKVIALETIVFLTMICELLFLCIRKQESSLIESIILLAAEVTFYLMIYLQDCLFELFASKEQVSLIEQEKAYYQREALIIQQKQELQKQFQHDLKNRLQILNEIADSGNLQELKKYLAEMAEKQRGHEIFSNTGNLIIDSIINSKLQDALEIGIEVEASVILPATIEINSDDMVVILGNLLDNAIEACKRLTSSRYIKLLLKYEEGCLIICIKNTFDQIINRNGETFITRKEDSGLHGLGIKSVKSTIEKYSGLLEITSQGSEFAVNIILYL